MLTNSDLLFNKKTKANNMLTHSDLQLYQLNQVHNELEF